MPEKITDVQEVHNCEFPNGGWNRYEGFQINTTKQRISIGIANEGSCCEVFGHVASEDDFSKFAGADLLGISITDTALNTKVAEEIKQDEEHHNSMFVNLETSVGTLQFAVYNNHNGYYGHSVRVASEQLMHEDII